MIVVGCGVVREEHEGISDDVITTELDIELTEGDTASKGSQSLPRITAVNRGALSRDFREVQMRRMCPSDRTAGLAPHFYTYLIKQLQLRPSVFRMNDTQTIFWKTWTTSPGIFHGLFHYVWCQCKLVLWNNG